MKTTDWIYFNILPTLAWGAINSLSVTLRIQTVGKDQIESMRKNRQRLIYTFWHGRQFLLVRYMSNKNLVIMSSTSRDGILQANILQKFGYEIVPGSSAKSPVRALIGSIQKMREGFDPAIAVDGPTGPIYKVKPGALYIAKKMNAPIIPLTFSANPAVTLKSWDRYLLPKPFARGVIVFGKPFYPSPKLDDKIIEQECNLLGKMLNQITKMADDITLHAPLH